MEIPDAKVNFKEYVTYKNPFGAAINCTKMTMRGSSNERITLEMHQTSNSNSIERDIFFLSPRKVQLYIRVKNHPQPY